MSDGPGTVEDGTAQKGGPTPPAIERTPPEWDDVPSRSAAASQASRRHLGAALTILAAMDVAAPVLARDAALAELRDAIRDQDDFLHAAAHDLRNPLTAIRGHVQLLQRRARRTGTPEFDPSRFDDGLAGIDLAVARTMELIDALLDASWQAAEPPIEGPKPQHDGAP